MTYLLDANVVIALTVKEHVHHDRAATWFAGIDGFAISPVVEGAVVRFHVRVGERPSTAQTIVAALRAHPKGQWWPDTVSYADADLSTVHGHRQVTDSYLVAVAREHAATLATFDDALAQRHAPHTLLVPEIP